MPSELRVDKVSSTTSPYDPVFSTTGGALSHRNMIINGAMQVAQRGTSFTGFGASVNYSLDRFFSFHSSDGAFTISQESSVVPTGFKNSLKILITQADASIAAGQRLIVGTRCEGNVVSHLNWGTSNAETVTLSFYVRSSITGTHGGAIGNGSDNRNYPFTYTISSADTWERKSITIAGDQTGTWATDNGRSLQVIWGLGVGATYSASAGSWGAGDISSATGATTGVLGTVNSTWYLSGVQLELGSVATPFEHRSYGEELLKCQRYYQNSYRQDAEVVGGGSTKYPHEQPAVEDGIYNCSWNDGNIIGPTFITAMRTQPSVTFKGHQSNNTGKCTVNGVEQTASISAYNHQYVSHMTIGGSHGTGAYVHYAYEASAEL